MKKIYTGALVFDPETHTFLSRCVVTEEDRILAVTESADGYDDAEQIDCSGLYLIPGLVDVHTHGRAGTDFTETYTGDPEKDRQTTDAMMLSYARRGTTSVMATLASAPVDNWLDTTAFLADYARSSHAGAHIPGIHLEGNFLSQKRRGAHAQELLIPPSADILEKIAALTDGLVLHTSIAPELEGSDAYIAAAVRLGATVGIAHSDATFEEAQHAIRSGARSFTHTFNAMSPLHHRMPGCVGAALITDEAYAELICDGFHSHPAIACLLARSKAPDKLVLITDSMQAAGCADGEYMIAGIPVIVKDGKALNTEGAIAGSTISLFDGLTNFMQFTGLPLEYALVLATENPARMVGAYDQIGSVSAGKRADFLLIENKENPLLKTVVCGGKTVE